MIKILDSFALAEFLSLCSRNTATVLSRISHEADVTTEHALRYIPAQRRCSAYIPELRSDSVFVYNA